MNKILKAVLIEKENIENNSMEFKLSDHRSQEIFMAGYECAIRAIINYLKDEKEVIKK